VAKAKEIFEAIREYEKPRRDTSASIQCGTASNTYRSLMEQFASLDKKPTPQRSAAEKAIRKKVKRLLQLRRASLKSSASDCRACSDKPVDTYSTVKHSFLSQVGHRQILSRIVVKPLKSLEWTMKSIADGKFSTIAMDSSDQEIVPLPMPSTR